MNLDLFKQSLIGATASRFSWEELEPDDNNVVLGTRFNSKKFDDTVRMIVEFDAEGTLIVTFIFDTISCNKEVILLINHFNANV